MLCNKANKTIWQTRSLIAGWQSVKLIQAFTEASSVPALQIEHIWTRPTMSLELWSRPTMSRPDGVFRGI